MLIIKVLEIAMCPGFCQSKINFCRSHTNLTIKIVAGTATNC